MVVEQIKEELQKIRKALESYDKDRVISERDFIERLERIERLCEENHKANEGIRAMFENINDSLEDDACADMDLQEKEYIITEQDGYIHHLEDMLEKANKKIGKQRKKIKKLKKRIKTLQEVIAEDEYAL